MGYDLPRQQQRSLVGVNSEVTLYTTGLVSKCWTTIPWGWGLKKDGCVRLKF